MLAAVTAAMLDAETDDRRTVVVVGPGDGAVVATEERQRRKAVRSRLIVMDLLGWRPLLLMDRAEGTH
jgi:hypothetical protein